MLKVKEAKEELNAKSYQDIQRETAEKWGARSCAAFDGVLTAPDKEKVAAWTAAVEYQTESLEHAAAVTQTGFLEKIRDEIDPYAAKAAKELEKLFGQKL